MKSAWIDYYGNVRNTYGNAGDGEIIEVDKYFLELIFGKGNVQRITSKSGQIKGGDWVCTDSLGRKIYIDVKGDHYPNPTNILLEAMDGYGHSWLQTTSKMQHITNYILYIRYNATNDSITASLIDYEYLTKVFVYTDLYKDRVLYNIGDKTIGSYFREDELPSVPKFYPELGRVVKPLVRTLKVLKSKFSIEIQNKIKKYTENKHTMADFRKYFNYSMLDEPNNKKELEETLGKESSAAKRVLSKYDAEQVWIKMIKKHNEIFRQV